MKVFNAASRTLLMLPTLLVLRGSTCAGTLQFLQQRLQSTGVAAADLWAHGHID